MAYPEPAYEEKEICADIKPHPGRRMTEEEFVEWCAPGTWAEWINGNVIVASPVSIRHGDLSFFLAELVHGFVRRTTKGKVMGPEIQIRLSHILQRRIPDLMYVAPEHLDRLRTNHLEGPPNIAFEIVSPESTERDWQQKFFHYQNGGVPEYWIIDPLSRQLSVYALVNGAYQKLEPIERKLHSKVLDGFYLRPEWFWAEVQPEPAQILKEMLPQSI